MTTFIIAKLKKSDDQTNIDKYKVAENITEYHIISILIFQIYDDKELLHVRNVCKNVNILKMDILTIWSQL